MKMDLIITDLEADMIEKKHDELGLLCSIPFCSQAKTILPPDKDKPKLVLTVVPGTEGEKFTGIFESKGRSKYCYYHDKMINELGMKREDFIWKL